METIRNSISILIFDQRSTGTLKNGVVANSPGTTLSRTYAGKR
jgi:hypothetical protein